MRRFVRWLPVLILIPLWGSGLVLDRIAERVLLDSVHERMLTALHAHQRHVLAMLAHQQRGLQLFSVGAVQLLAQGKAPQLDGRYLSTHLSEAIGCLLLDAQGRLVTHTAAPWPPPLEIVGNIPADLSKALVTDPISDPGDPSGGSVYDVWLPLATPEGNRVGMLACRLKNILSQVLTEHRQGLGLTGEVYLVSAKTHLMLTESRFLPNAIGRVKVDTIGVREALKMRNGIAPYPDYRGIPVIGTFLYLRDYDWVLLAEMDEAEALAPMFRLRMVFGLSLVLISVVAGVVGRRYGRQMAGLYEQTQAAEFQTKTLLNTAQDAVFEIDEASTILQANESAHRMFGWSSGELIGRKVTVLMSPEDGVKHQAGLRRYLETGESRVIGKCVEVTGLRRDGSRFFCELSVAAMTLPDGRRRFIGVHRDVTERKRAEEELEQANAALNAQYRELQETYVKIEQAKKEWEATFDAIADPLFIHDHAFRIVRANQAYADAAGMPLAELNGRLYYEVFPKTDGPLKRCLKAMEQGVRNGEEEEDDEQVLGPTPGKRYRTRLFSMQDSAGEYVRGIHVMEDITERKTMETHARRLEQLAAMGQLLGGISHEMKNPLFVLTGRLQLLKEKLAHREYDSLGSDLQPIEDAAQRMTKIAQRFLFLAKPTPPSIQSCSVQDTLEKVLDFLSNELMKHRIRVVREWEPALSKTQIWSDPQALHQIFLNLILNAMQAMAQAHGQGTLTVATAVSNGWIEVRIQDDGPGIPPEHNAKLFEPFFTTKAAGAGTGLGLWTVRVALTELKGQVTFETEVGRGTTFVVRLPLPHEPLPAGDRGVLPRDDNRPVNVYNMIRLRDGQERGAD